MNTMEVIRTRRSVRTFDGRNLVPEDLEKLQAFIGTIANPYGIPVEFVLLDAEEHGLSSPVLAGETLYVAAKIGKVPHAEEAFGFSFEKLLLYAWSLGIGTTWIGGTMKRELFEKAHKAGKKIGVSYGLCSVEEMQRYERLGVDMISLGGDADFIVKGSRDLCRTMKEVFLK